MVTDREPAAADRALLAAVSAALVATAKKIGGRGDSGGAGR
jgi:hypothetical protein